MASFTRPHPPSDLRSGGKIVRPRRTSAPRIPYDRPPKLPPTSGSQNPNWLSRLILSPTRMIASGAGKFLSVFRSDSSCSSSDGDFTSDGDSDDANNDTGVSPQELEKMNSLGKDLQAIEWKSETKRAIERILKQETFSREECDRLTYIIKSRVVDSPVTGGLGGRPSEISNRIISSDVDMPDLCSAAVTEAKKWLEKKKLASNPKPQLDYGICTLNTTMSPLVTDGETGTPVDLAKSYMRERPPWTSPSINNILLKSPSPMGIQFFKDDTSNLYGGNSGSTSKVMRDSSSIGSWNTLEEIQKMRSRATEDILRTQPSSIIDWPMLASDNKRSPGSLVADKTDSVSPLPRDGLLNEASPRHPTASILQQSQIPNDYINFSMKDLITIQSTEGAEGLLDSSVGRLNHRQGLQPSEDKSESRRDDIAADGSGKQLKSTAEGNTQDYRWHEMHCSTSVEVAVKDGKAAANGFPSSGSSLYAECQGAQKFKSSGEQQKLGDAEDDNMKTSVPVDERCELLSEANIEVPIVNDNDNVVSGSQDSSSMQHEDRPNVKRKAGKRNDVTWTEKQQGAKRRNLRKAKGRGK